jgi:septum formation protein
MAQFGQGVWLVKNNLRKDIIALKKLILASNSPRRQELLKGLDLDFEVRVKRGVGESYPADLPAENVAEYISREKAAAYDMSDDEILLTADTVVILDGEIMGKPKDADDARAMLHRLSGHTHHVVTGVNIKTKQRSESFSDITAVTFRQLTDDEIDYYIERYKPFDKAGSYGVQEWIGYIGVTRIEGSFYNVMGLPVERVYEELTKFM